MWFLENEFGCLGAGVSIQTSPAKCELIGAIQPRSWCEAVSISSQTVEQQHLWPIYTGFSLLCPPSVGIQPSNKHGPITEATWHVWSQPWTWPQSRNKMTSPSLAKSTFMPSCILTAQLRLLGKAFGVLTSQVSWSTIFSHWLTADSPSRL